MENTISLWELDVVNVIEPLAVLGTKIDTNQSKKKKVSQTEFSCPQKYLHIESIC